MIMTITKQKMDIPTVMIMMMRIRMNLEIRKYWTKKS